VNVSLSPEFALLLDAAVPQAAPRADHRGWDKARWDRVCQLAAWHRVGPLLYSHLRTDTAVPAGASAALQQAYFDNAARNLYMGASTREALGALHAAGVPAMLLKGAALIETVYDDPAVREMLDLDLLVPAHRLADATSVIAGLGYRASAADAEHTAGTPAHHDAALVDRESLLAVELHRHIVIEHEGRAFDIDDIWLRARTAGDGEHLLPSPDDLLLHVCFHFTRNRLGGSHGRRNTGGAIAQLADIARLVERETIDWDRLARSARSYGLETRVFLALFAAHELGVPVPAYAMTNIRPAGFDTDLGRRLVELRVVRGGDHLPVRSLKWMIAPSREALERRWQATGESKRSLALAYARRARANAPLLRSALRQPWTVVQDRRLNDRIYSLEERSYMAERS
jgi:Uncharacterised nucleotidyltransferase